MGATSQRGGARPGAGRKPKKHEDDLHLRLRKAFKPKDLDEIFEQLKKDTKSQSFSTRYKSREQLFAYLYGKPVNRVEEPPEQEDNLAPPIGDAIERIYGGDGGTDSGG